jgi:response regulator RpfG family c-di-GMP phosphodiesterase
MRRLQKRKKEKKGKILDTNSNDYVAPVEKRPTVMICDDEADILRLYSKFIREKFNVITASTGESCLLQYRREKEEGRKVDVLLLDYRLGDMLGDAVACQIKKLNGTKTIMISAYDLDKNMLQDLRERNCIVAEMKKPVSLENLEGMITKVLHR